MKTGVQKLCNQLKKLDSGFRRNDKKWCFSTFYEFINIDYLRYRFAPSFLLKSIELLKYSIWLWHKSCANMMWFEQTGNNPDKLEKCLFGPLAAGRWTKACPGAIRLEYLLALGKAHNWPSLTTGHSKPGLGQGLKWLKLRNFVTFYMSTGGTLLWYHYPR